MEQAVGNLSVRTAHFGAADVATLTRENGDAVFLARQISIALGYPEGDDLGSQVRRDWKNDFVDGVDCLLATGPELSALKSAGLVGKNAPSALLLTESGVNLAAILSRRPESTRLRQWLAREVMPQIRKQGAYGVADVRRAKSEAMLEVVQHLPAGVAVQKLREALDAVPDRAAEIARYALDLVGKAPKAQAQPAEPAPVKRMSAVHAARSVLASALEQRERLATTGGPKSKERGDFIGRFSTDGNDWEWVALRREFVDRHLKAMGLTPARVLAAWRDANLVNGRYKVHGGAKSTTRTISMPGQVDREEMLRFERATVDNLMDRSRPPFIAHTAILEAEVDPEVVEDVADAIEHRSSR